MARVTAPGRPTSLPLTILAIAAVIAGLYVGRDVLIPLALAVLLAFLLAPLASRLQRWRIPRIPAVLLTVMVAISIAAMVGWVAMVQVVDVALNLPTYKERIVARIAPLRAGAQGVLDRAADAVRELQEDIAEEMEKDSERKAAEAAPTPGDAAEQRTGERERRRQPEPPPVPVQVIEPSANPLLFIRSLLAPLLRPAVLGAIVVVFVIFFLIKREDLRDRLLRLAGTRQLNVSTQALDDAAQRISRFLLMMSINNAIVGTALGVGLYFIGVPNAALWGMLGFALRFIPYVGAITTGIIPIALSLAVFEGWREPLLTIGLILTIEVISNNFVEPWLYGRGTGISVVAVLVGAVFWAWLWGPVGLLLATPLTVCLVVMGRHIPHLAFLNFLLSDEPALAPHEHLYQRLLALDGDEAAEVVEAFMSNHEPAELFDAVLMPTMLLAERDRHRGTLSPQQQEFVFQAAREFIEDFETDADAARIGRDAKPVRIVCVPARDEADELVGCMLAEILKAEGAPVKVIAATGLSGERIEQAAKLAPAVVFVSALQPLTMLHTRGIVRRLRACLPGAHIIIGLWGSAGDPKKARDRLQLAVGERLVTTLAEAANIAPDLAGVKKRAEPLPPSAATAA